MTCPHCHLPHAGTPLFCPECGGALDAPAPTPRSSPPPSAPAPWTSGPAVAIAPVPAAPPARAAAPLAGDVVRGHVLRHDRGVERVAGLAWHRPAATALVVLAWLPALVLPVLCLLAATLLAAGLVARMLLVARLRPAAPAGTVGPERGDEILVSIGPDQRRTVEVRRYVVGPLAVGDEVELQVRRVGPELHLVRGRNLSQGGVPVRPPVDPWPGVLLAMIAWTGVLLLAYPG